MLDNSASVQQKQHPISPFIAGFARVAGRLIVELDDIEATSLGEGHPLEIGQDSH